MYFQIRSVELHVGDVMTVRTDMRAYIPVTIASAAASDLEPSIACLCIQV